MNENKTSCAPADNQQTLWDRIDWTKAELAVRKLQARIVKAQKEGRYNKVKALQWTLTHSFYAKALAVKRVTSNGGGNTPGVDMETWEKPEAKTQAISELKRRGYQPKPLRRVHIKKSNGKLRPLGIPTMKDRAMQALYLMALEPVSETTADSRSYGFRKERRCMDAVMQCHNILRKGYSPEWILEGDIKGCFDHISHEWLLANIPMDKAILRKWLKCGYIFNKQMFPTEEGTPQGGIISPTLANMTLDGLQKVLAEKYKRVRIKGKLYSPMVNLVRYADDFIITCENRETLEKEIKPLVADFMSERGLTLSEEKTVITNIRDGFDFLGFNIRKFGNEILTKPTKKAEKRFMENIRKVTKGHKGCKQESLIRMLNAKIRGWGAYYQHGATRDSFHRIDHQIFLALWQWAKRRHSKKGKQWIKDRYWHNIRGNSWTFAAKFKKSNGKEDQLTLLKLASSFPFLQYTQIKGDMNPFDADCRLYFNKRMKSKMLVTLKGRKSLLYLWEKQGRKCPICGEPIDTHKAWNVMPTVQDGRKCNLLVHDECFKLSRKNRRYGSMDNLYDRLAKQYDFWINDAIDVSSLNILGPKKFFAETFKTLYRNLSDNTVMQKLLLYEMSVINETTKRTAETRDIMNLNLIAFYDNLFKPAKINIKAIMANLIGGIYYLILHRRCAKTCTIDFSTQEGEKVFFEWIDYLTDTIFDKLEAYERNRKAAQEMLSDGISEFKICKYMGINKNDLRILLSK